jgi:hypothetical protein
MRFQHPLARLGVYRLRYKNMFGGSGGQQQAAPVAPTPTPPPTMPDPWGPAAREAARRAGAGMAKGGRSSTVLTRTAAQAPGGTNFLSTTLGGGH